MVVLLCISSWILANKPEPQDTLYSAKFNSKYINYGYYVRVLFDDGDLDDAYLIVGISYEEPDTSYKKKTDEQMRKLDSILKKKK